MGVGSIDEEVGVLQVGYVELLLYVVGQCIVGDVFGQCDVVIDIDLEEIQ